MKAFFEQQCAAYDTNDYWHIHQWNLQTIQANARDTVIPLSPGSRKRKRGPDGEESDKDTKRPEPIFSTTTPREPSSEPYNYYEGITCAKQLAETLPSFFQRLPPSRTTTESINSPWIYICNPHTTWRPHERISEFKQAGHALLEGHKSLRHKMESSNPDKAVSTITRLLNPYRNRLELDLASCARQHNVLSGKWMLFPSHAFVDQAWFKVAKATWEGRLGHAAKVALDAADPHKDDHVICIYTDDFTNKDDVLRVLRELKMMGLAHDGLDERGIYYKADAYTYLDIKGQNEWRLKVSMYSSRDLLKGIR